MTTEIRQHLEEAERQMCLATLYRECGDSVGYHIAMAAAYRASSKARRSARGSV